eukprot:8477952-Alexandrium_andersonii.AAC.1
MCIRDRGLARDTPACGAHDPPSNHPLESDDGRAHGIAGSRHHPHSVVRRIAPEGDEGGPGGRR